MPTNIIPFPKSVGHESSDVELLIRKWLENMSASPELTEHVVKNMMDFIDRYATRIFEPVFNLPVSPNLPKEEAEGLLKAIEEGVDNIAVQVQEIINGIIVERFFFEVEVFERNNQIRQNKKYN